jgi:hypothetical protein
VTLVNGPFYDLGGIFVLRTRMNFLCGKWLAPVHSRNSLRNRLRFHPHAFPHFLRSVCTSRSRIGIRQGVDGAETATSEDENVQIGFEVPASLPDYALLAPRAGKRLERRRAAISCSHGTKMFHFIPVCAT